MRAGLRFDALRSAFGAGDATPSDALGVCKAAIEAENPRLNAIVHADWTRAEQDAAASDVRWRAGAPLSLIDGAPIAVKANCAVEGLPWTAALKPLAARSAGADSEVVARLRAAGAVIVGVANMHEAALGATTDSPLYGRCINPLRDGYTPGGSSGGSAAAVAAGFCAGAIGTDTMGSVRVPSSYCGVVGFKPSRGRISTRGVIPLSTTLDHVGVHAASVADARGLYRLCAGVDQRSREDAAPAAFRVGVADWDVALAPGVERAFARAIAALTAAGVAITAIDLRGAALARMRRRGLLICEAEFAAAFPDMDAGALSAALAGMLAWAAKQHPAKLEEAYAEIEAAERLAHDVFAQADVLLSPATPQTAFPHDAPAPENQADLTVLADFAGLPAVCLPMGEAEDGLPASLQVMAARGADERALAFAAFAEAAGFS
ncbi:MAG: amidase [Alphaproteobacteria bacterium]|nr:amidase [Alphaproteobacteria bacterium]